MSFFKKIRDLFTGTSSPTRRSRPSRPSFDELNFVRAIGRDELNQWGRTLTPENHDAIKTAIAEIARKGKDYLRFAAMVRHLHQKYPSQPMFLHIDAAQRKIDPLATRFANLSEYEWSEAELDQWLDTLDDFYTNQVQNAIRKWRAAGGRDGKQLQRFLCGLRRTIEQCEAKAAAEDAAEDAKHSTNLLHLWYVWQEEGRKMEQHEYFKNQNSEARKRGYN